MEDKRAYDEKTLKARNLIMSAKTVSKLVEKCSNHSTFQKPKPISNLLKDTNIQLKLAFYKSLMKFWRQNISKLNFIWVVSRFQHQRSHNLWWLLQNIWLAMKVLRLISASLFSLGISNSLYLVFIPSSQSSLKMVFYEVQYLDR